MVLALIAPRERASSELHAPVVEHPELLRGISVLPRGLVHTRGQLRRRRAAEQLPWRPVQLDFELRRPVREQAVPKLALELESRAGEAVHRGTVGPVGRWNDAFGTVDALERLAGAKTDFGIRRRGGRAKR